MLTFYVVLVLYAFCCDVTFYSWVFWVSAKINFVLLCADDNLWVEILVLRDILCRFFTLSLKELCSSSIWNSPIIVGLEEVVTYW